jgi:putative transposase
MEAYKRGGHTVWGCKYHLAWVTKYRYAVLGGDVGARCRGLFRETARAHEMVVHAGSINRDHVHMLLSIPPSLSVSRAVQHLKGRSSHKLLSDISLRDSCNPIRFNRISEREMFEMSGNGTGDWSGTYWAKYQGSLPRRMSCRDVFAQWGRAGLPFRFPIP